MGFVSGTDPNENFAQGPTGSLPFDQNIMTRAHQFWLRSNNALIYPGQYTVSGTWAAGDTATVRVAWGPNNLSFNYVVQVGEGQQQIAMALATKMANDPTLIAATMGINVPSQYGGGWSWQINPQYGMWTANPRLSLSASATSANGHVSVALQPVNILDTPGATLTLSHSVPGRPAQYEDLVMEITAYGQNDIITSPTDEDLRQIYGRLQVYIADPHHNHPKGRWQFQRASANANAVTNSVIFGDGVWLCDANGQHPQGGPMGDGDMGAGSINLPPGGGIYRDGVKIL